MEEKILDEEIYDEDSLKDKYLTFRLADEDYGVEIRFVLEIIGLQKITVVPDLPNFVKGVINLRGKIIPVIDIRTRFNFSFRDYDDRTCIIVVDVKGVQTGLIVDEVSEVIDIDEKNIQPPPKTAKTKKEKYIQGLGKINNTVKIILDIEHLLSSEDLENISEISKS